MRYWGEFEVGKLYRVKHPLGWGIGLADGFELKQNDVIFVVGFIGTDILFGKDCKVYKILFISQIHEIVLSAYSAIFENCWEVVVNV